MEEKYPSSCKCCSDKKSIGGKISRNAKVSVKYIDGLIEREIKYKLVEHDLKLNQCVLLD